MGRVVQDRGEKTRKEGLPMKKMVITWMSLVFTLLPVVCSADAPRGTGIFVLGASIDGVKEHLKMETSLPIRHREYLREVQTKAIEGFKSGLICYGTSTTPGRIVRIKLKYADSSEMFFKELLKQFKKRFGEAKEWRGDPFHIFKAWKWSFIDNENNRISLILQHNTMDPSEKLGNCVKLTMWNLVDEEHRLFIEKHPKPETSKKHRSSESRKLDTVDWDRFVPR